MSQLLFSIGKYITGFPNYALMPIIITLLALVLGADLKKAFRSGLLVGIGFIGIGMATSVFLGEVTPVSKNIVTNLGFGKEILDVGWPVAAAIAFASRIGSVIFIIGLLVNLIMLVLKLTKTVDVDIWNYWGWAFAGGIVASVTNSFWLGCLAAAIYAVITLLLADHTAPPCFKNIMAGLTFPSPMPAAWRFGSYSIPYPDCSRVWDGRTQRRNLIFRKCAKMSAFLAIQ